MNKLNNTYQQKMLNGKKNAVGKQIENKKIILYNKQKQNELDDSLSDDDYKKGNMLNEKLQSNYSPRSNNKDGNNSFERLKKIKEDETLSLLMKKEQLWLKSEIARKKKEKIKKLKSTLKTEQNTREEYKKKGEEIIKLKMKRKQMLEEKRKKQKSEKERTAKKHFSLDEREIFKQQTELRKEQNLRLEALKLKAERIAEEEEAWRNKINQAYTLKMGYSFISKQHNLSIENIINENSMGKTIKKRITQHTNNLLNEIKQNYQVFDPGNLMKQIIKKELKMGDKRKVKLNKRLTVYDEAFDDTKNTPTVKTEERIKKYDPPKDKVIKTQYEDDSAFDSKTKVMKSFEQNVLHKHKQISTCKMHNVHCDNTTIFNTVVCNWKNEVDRVTANIRNCQYNLIQNSKDHDMWEKKIFN